MLRSNEQLSRRECRITGRANEAGRIDADKVKLASSIELKLAVDQQAISSEFGDTGTTKGPFSVRQEAIERNRGAAHQGVFAIHNSPHACIPVAPSHGTNPRAVTAARAPLRAEHQIVTTAQTGDAIGTHLITDVAANQRIDTAHHAVHAAAAAAPRHRSKASRSAAAVAVAPIGAADNVVAIAQCRDAVIADGVIWIAPNQRVGAAHHAAHAAAAAAPGHRSRITVPITATNNVVAIAQCSDAVNTDGVIWIATNQRVGTGYHATHATSAAPPGHSSLTEVVRGVTTTRPPVRTTHKVVAAAQLGDAIDTRGTHLITEVAANQRVGATHHAAHATSATAPGDRAQR